MSTVAGYESRPSHRWAPAAPQAMYRLRSQTAEEYHVLIRAADQLVVWRSGTEASVAAPELFPFSSTTCSTAGHELSLARPLHPSHCTPISSAPLICPYSFYHRASQVWFGAFDVRPKSIVEAFPIDSRDFMGRSPPSVSRFLPPPVLPCQTCFRQRGAGCATIGHQLPSEWASSAPDTLRPSMF